MKRVIPWLVSISMLVSQASDAQTARLEPEQVVSGEVTQLVVELESKIPSLYSLDMTPLLRDFRILDSQSRIITNYEGDEVQRMMQWKVDLLPLGTGRLQIPSLKLGRLPTPPLTMDVLPQSPQQQRQQDIFVEFDVSPATPYVGQQALATMRLYYNTQLLEGQLKEPDADAVRLFRNNRDRRYRVNRDGVEYQVLERKLAMVFERAGPIGIKPAEFHGKIESFRADSRWMTRRIVRSAADSTIEVLPRPGESAASHWLPATTLELREHWDQDLSSVTTADSLKRTITIVASGVTAESLPDDLFQSDDATFRVYGDQPQRDNHFDGNLLIAELRQSFAVIATRAGVLTVPELNLSWWDAGEGRQRVVSLPPRSIEVADAPVAELQIKDPFLQQISAKLDGGEKAPDSVQKASLAILMLLIFSALLLYARGFGKLVAQWRNWTHRKPGRAVMLACLSNNAPEARRQILDWGRRRWPGDSLLNIAILSGRTDNPRLKQAFARLDAAIYRAPASEWRGEDLWHLLSRENFTQTDRHRAPARTLPDLYPPPAHRTETNYRLRPSRRPA